jgi:hypothetical protein
MELVIIEDVLAVTDGLALICEVNGRRFGVPWARIARCIEVKRPGDRGRLVIPRQVAEALGMLAGKES